MLILVAAARSWCDLDWTGWVSWAFAGGLAAMLAGIAVLYAAMQARARAQA